MLRVKRSLSQYLKSLPSRGGLCPPSPGLTSKVHQARHAPGLPPSGPPPSHTPGSMLSRSPAPPWTTAAPSPPAPQSGGHSCGWGDAGARSLVFPPKHYSSLTSCTRHHQATPANPTLSNHALLLSRTPHTHLQSSLYRVGAGLPPHLPSPHTHPMEWEQGIKKHTLPHTHLKRGSQAPTHTHHPPPPTHTYGVGARRRQAAGEGGGLSRRRQPAQRAGPRL